MIIACVGLAGCRGWQPSAPSPSPATNRQSLLKPVDTSADDFRLEIVTVRFPLGDSDLNGSAWTQIDEQLIPSDTRRTLADNGLRAGVILGQLPEEISRLITAAERPETLTEAAANFSEPPVVTRQQMQLHSGWRGQIVASRTYDEIPLLIREDEDIVGRPYQFAQGIFNVAAVATGDHRVKLRFTPELHHGQSRQTFVSEPEDGMLRPQAGKQKQNFDWLAFDAALLPQQMLVMTSLPNRPGTLGHYFFTEPLADRVQQKLMIVRLEQSRHSDLFARDRLAGDLPAVR